MGNKNSNLPKGPEAEATQKEEGVPVDGTTGSVPRDDSQGPTPELLASLQSLGENSDYTLLPHSLHQIAEAYSLKEDYQWAIQFLQLEKLYHERLLSNLTVLQENWESQWGPKDSDSSLPAEADGICEKHFETLSQICRTHLRPSVSVEQNKLNTTIEDNQTKSKAPQPHHDEVDMTQTAQQEEEKEQSTISDLELSSLQADCEEEDGGTCEEGQEVEEEEEQCEETPEEEEVKVEWPTGVPQASDKELAKLSHKDGECSYVRGEQLGKELSARRLSSMSGRVLKENSSQDGLVSILKRRRASLDGLPPPSTTANKQNSKRKVRFSEPEDGTEHDEVGGDSCLILLLLCLVTVVISIGGTALYCTLLDTYSNICTDFTHNVDFYVMNLRRLVEGLGRWLPFRT